MKIGLDLINLSSLADGMGRFAGQLVSGLSQMDRENKYFLFLNAQISGDFGVGTGQFKILKIRVPRKRMLPWNQVYFLSLSWALPPLDILHSPVSLSPLVILRRLKKIVTVHDLAFKLFPETASRKSLLWWNSAWPLCLKNVDHIVADSQNTKRDLRTFYNVDENKVSVVYPYSSISAASVADDTLALLRSKYNLPDRFLLFVGAPHKRKNIDSLIQGFHIFKHATALPHKLVLVGPKGWALESLVAQIKRLRLEDDVLITGFVTDGDMAIFYRAAELLIYPSFYEGFGYPPLEAMTMGAPVLMARTSSLPEVGGDAAVYIDPFSPADMAEKLERVIRDVEGSNDLRSRGRERAGQFNMARTIRGYLDVYQRVSAA
ncbi:MAG: glycosyltransferase family 1 protein [Acidobacteriota bacterium]|nr:glycosyltransferase family 1 protein [Acidobacteriota bacterium]